MNTAALAPTSPAELVTCTALPADRNPAAVYLARLAPGSRRAQRQALNLAASLLGGVDAQTCEWSALRYQHTQALRARLCERYAPATVNRVLTAVRGALQEAWRLGLVSAEHYTRAVDVQNVKAHREPAGRAVDGGELGRLFACLDTATAKGARDAALLAVLVGCGLRRAELVALALSDLDADTGALRVRHGKGDKSRTVYVTNGALRAVQAWLVVRGSEPGPLFVSVRKGGRLEAKGMSAQAVFATLRELATRAGVAQFSPHDCRRTFVSTLLDAGADLVSVQKLAGHEQIQTTARYDRRGEVAKQRAASLLHVPFAA